MSKPLHAGRAAEAGVLAALAAAKGVTGVHDILEGEVGFGAAMSVKPDWEKATRGLGTDYNIVHVTFKNHGCCGHTFPSLDAVIELRNKHKLAPKDVAKIRIAHLPGRPRRGGQLQARGRLPGEVQPALRGGARADPRQRAAERLRARPAERPAAARADERRSSSRPTPSSRKAFPAPARGARRDRDRGRAQALALPGNAQGRPRAAAHRRRTRTTSSSNSRRRSWATRARERC